MCILDSTGYSLCHYFCAYLYYCTRTAVTALSRHMSKRTATRTLKGCQKESLPIGFVVRRMRGRNRPRYVSKHTDIIYPNVPSSSRHWINCTFAVFSLLPKAGAIRCLDFPSTRIKRFKLVMYQEVIVILAWNACPGTLDDKNTAG